MANPTATLVAGSGDFNAATQNQDGSRHKDRKATNILTKNASEMVGSLAKNTEGWTPLLQTGAKHSARISANTASIVTAVNAINRTLQAMLSSTRQYQKMQTQMGQEAQKMRQLQHQQAMFDQQMAAVAERQNRGASAAPPVAAAASSAPSNAGGGSGQKGVAGGGLLGAGLGVGLGALLGQGAGGMIGGGIGGALFGPMGAVLGATLGKPLMEIGKKIDNRLGKPIANLYSTVKTFAKNVWDWLPKSWDQLIPKLSDLWAKKIWPPVKQWATDFWTKKIWPTVKQGASDLWSKSVGPGLAKMFDNSIEKLPSLLWGCIKTAVKMPFAAVGGAFKGAADGLWDGSVKGDDRMQRSKGVVNKMLSSLGVLADLGGGLIGGAVKGGVKGVVGNAVGGFKGAAKTMTNEGDVPPDLFSLKVPQGIRDSVAVDRAGASRERIPLNVAALSTDVAMGPNPTDPRKQGWTSGGMWMSKAKMQREEAAANAHRLERRAQMSEVALHKAVSAGIGNSGIGVNDNEAAADPNWRGFRTFTPDGKKAYLKNGKYETVDEWDPNDGTQGEGGGWLSKLFGGMWGGLGDLFGAKGKAVGGGQLNWNNREGGLQPGLKTRIEELARQSGENLTVNSGLRTPKDIDRLYREYTYKYGEPVAGTKGYWKWPASKTGTGQDQILNWVGYSTHETGRAVDLQINGKAWGDPAYRNLNRLAKPLGLHGYRNTEVKGHFNILPQDDKTTLSSQGDPPPVPTPAPMPALATADDLRSGGSKGGGTTVVGGSTTNVYNAPQSSGGGGGNAFPAELWAFLNGMNSAPSAGFA